jgi:hypothetical protein
LQRHQAGVLAFMYDFNGSFAHFLKCLTQ